MVVLAVLVAALTFAVACAKTPPAPELPPVKVVPPVVTEGVDATPEETAEMTEAPTTLPPTPTPTPEPIVIAMAGDVLTGERIGPQIEAGKPENLLDAETAELMRNADVTVINYESSISTRGSPADKTYTFRGKPEHTAFLRDYLGVDGAGLANNHTLDYGWDAFYDTLDYLREYDITPFGAGNNLAEAAAPYIAEVGDKKIAFFSSNQILPGASWRAGENSPGQLVSKEPSNLGALADGIKAARETCDYVIVYMHWGIERDTLPNTTQKTTAHNLIDLGADIVIGAHPHVVQSFELYNGKPIVYSLGNFIFNSRNPQTLLLLITIEHDGTITLKAVPCKMNGTLTYMVKGAEATELLDKWSGLSIECVFDENGVLTAMPGKTPQSGYVAPKTTPTTTPTPTQTATPTPEETTSPDNPAATPTPVPTENVEEQTEPSAENT